jgi:glucose/arabinose dehydrogenase
MKRTKPLLALSAVLALALAFVVNLDGLRRWIVEVLPQDYQAEAAVMSAAYTGADEQRPRVGVHLEPVLSGLTEPTDLQFQPGEEGLLVVCEKGGDLKWFELGTEASGLAAHVDVKTKSEEGLLGLAFHPRFEENGRFYLNYVEDSPTGDTSVVEEWVAAAGDMRGQVQARRRILEVGQPYANHDAGQLQFGPDGMLYVGWGDGGFRNDPKGHGQRTETWLGAMLRLDVDGGDPYAVPPDNPFVGVEGFQPEIWAYGLRNPWRYSFAPDGRLVVADVGQDQWEEVDIVSAGDNLGWNVREASHCFPPEESCSAEGMVDPVWEYGRDEGQSITGGYVYTGAALPELQGLFVLADFISGRIWAIDLPEAGKATPRTLGKWPILVSTFGQDAAGELYLADYGTGKVYKLVPPS